MDNRRWTKRTVWGPMALLMGVIGGTTGVISLIKSSKNAHNIITLTHMIEKQNEIIKTNVELTLQVANHWNLFNDDMINDGMIRLDFPWLLV